MQESNFYVTASLDRVALRRRNSAWLAARLAEPRTRLLPVWRGQNLVRQASAPAAVVLELAEAPALVQASAEVALLGLVDDIAHFAVDLSHLEEPPQFPGAHFT